jgi:hypothetical protein
MTQGESSLGEKALSKVAEVGISSQLDEVESLDVEIHTDPGKALQGEVDSVQIEGKGMVMQQDLRIETLEVNTDSVSINPISALFGNIELNRPTAATARIELTETDINRAFGSEFVLKKLKNLEMHVNDRPTFVDVNHAEVKLPGDGKFVVFANLFLQETNESKQISATTIPNIQDDGYRLSLEVLSAEAEGFSLELILAIFEQLTNLLDLRNFEIPGMSLRLQRLETQAGRLVIHSTTIINKIPAA